MIKTEVVKFNILNTKEYEEINDFYQLIVLNKNNETFQDKFRIGIGGFSDVYRINKYAIKVFSTNYLPGRKNKNDISAMRDQDGVILSNLQNISIYPKLYYSFSNKYIVTEFIEGKRMDRSSEYSNNFLKDLYFGLYETIDNGYLPYDLHFHNILVDKNGNPKVIDVGSFKKEWNINDLENFQEELIKLRSNMPEYMWNLYYKYEDLYDDE
jgi:RIO-like serine/threonine protein kinase